MRTLLLLIFLLQPAPPRLSAYWDSATSATVSWSQSSRGCLYRQPQQGAAVFVGCCEKPGAYRITFGHVGPLDAAYRPRSGDVYRLETGGQSHRAPLIARPLYFPVFRA